MSNGNNHNKMFFKIQNKNTSEIRECFGLHKTARELKLDINNLQKVVKGKRKTHKDWKLFDG